ncbi:hypothetical protein [Parendozoicomonas haliclonae]|uniref:Calpain catalytic domain-containing protein n=1 Tax=Parendozoicomonas haliclonae TaxID=1960125 RepID=A0A1X7AN08_9GAMM|nr:hypothetical protein [Parendozoicomonas haliclonae]SMA49419.1 hypothetical protein EHSB41UT_03249 [Parendozoicomonas haliclonae]
MAQPCLQKSGSTSNLIEELGFEDVETQDKEYVEVHLKADKHIQAYFQGRTSWRVEPRRALNLKERTQPPGGQSTRLIHKLTRALSRDIRHYQVWPLPAGTSSPLKDDKAGNLPLVITDEALAEDWKGELLYSPRDYVLFRESGPSSADVAQNIERKSCFLLSAAASSAASPAGRLRLQSLMSKVEEQDLVEVTLYDVITESLVRVQVTPWRILTSNKCDVFSCSGDKAPLWPMILEKAYYGLMLDRRRLLTTCIDSAHKRGQSGLAAQLQVRLAMLPGTQSVGRNGGNLMKGVEALSIFQPLQPAWSLPGEPPRGVQYLLLNELEESDMSGFECALQQNIFKGIPVVLGRTDTFTEKLSMLKSGHLTNHAYSVVGLGHDRVTGQRGVFVMDPYGSNRDGEDNGVVSQIEFKGQQPQSSSEGNHTEQSVGLSKSGNSVFFVPLDELSQQFTRLAVGAGGIDILNRGCHGTGETIMVSWERPEGSTGKGSTGKGGTGKKEGSPLLQSLGEASFVVGNPQAVEPESTSPDVGRESGITNKSLLFSNTMSYPMVDMTSVETHTLNS